MAMLKKKKKKLCIQIKVLKTFPFCRQINQNKQKKALLYLNNISEVK